MGAGGRLAGRKPLGASGSGVAFPAYGVLILISIAAMLVSEGSSALGGHTVVRPPFLVWAPLVAGRRRDATGDRAASCQRCFSNVGFSDSQPTIGHRVPSPPRMDQAAISRNGREDRRGQRVRL